MLTDEMELVCVCALYVDRWRTVATTDIRRRRSDQFAEHIAKFRKHAGALRAYILHSMPKLSPSPTSSFAGHIFRLAKQQLVRLKDGGANIVAGVLT